MGKEYKPKYKLTIKYPRLPLKFESGDIVYYNALSKAYVREKFPHYAVDVNEVENNPDFWELIEEKPLFTTEDGVEVHCRDWELFGVEVSTFKRAVVTSKSLNRHSFLLFANKHKADEYIWRNKRLFSYEDFVEWYGCVFKLGRESIYETLEWLAIERSEQ